MVRISICQELQKHSDTLSSLLTSAKCLMVCRVCIKTVQPHSITHMRIYLGAKNTVRAEPQKYLPEQDEQNSFIHLTIELNSDDKVIITAVGFCVVSKSACRLQYVMFSV